MGLQSLREPVVNPENNGFSHFWSQRGEWVEEPNVRRGGESGVQRLVTDDGQTLYSKRQTGHIYRSWLHPFGRPTVLRERDALEGLNRLGVSVPQIVFCGAERTENEWRALLVTEALEGFEEFEKWLAAGGREQYGELLYEQMLSEIGKTLARMHLGRWQHSCLYIKHIFVRVTGEGAQARAEVALLDLEKGRRRWTAYGAAQHDMKQLRRHSSFSAADWQKLVYFYQAAFGSSIKGLES
ncbi:lipopolysaccharide kinase InaA family protein [Pseudomonas alliivorans]|uniref:lipopolysaccharide kinase InaA family protein n=1 Tax=Pseudomonas alliivorans TaxID=2810613 RepID=UPI001AE400BE|nr:lipopolysaccharide kinase InaA family protein [Pseudomonas alliivorans]MBP0951946.1 InaA protein [Pseudomonas alliivorans]MEE4571408.1 lipopolysaccharide kinase InaA family protein [Pseudomonas alliivorans]MEE4671262.1 lipopolysaccharide kinase InaA family protein [Pseudomonas alliivorans]MEE4706416.1 lipopolysaccharide kinase InaA family protein [Pseudomonas alliivorans]MEE4777783.1 lipopolysaccharide kinase InaA family protein [Pseudomonas alliivorans]